DVPRADPDEHVRSRDRIGQAAGETVRIGDLRDPGQAPLELLTVLMDDAVDVGDDHVPGTCGAQQAQDRGAGGPAPDSTMRAVEISFSTTRRALRSAATTTIAVPC